MSEWNEAIEAAAKVLDSHSREYGAIQPGKSLENRRLDYAAERALWDAAEAVRALKRPEAKEVPDLFNPILHKPNEWSRP